MHPLRNGSQAAVRPVAKPFSGSPGWFTESGENNVPSYPGADWFNHVIAEFQNAINGMGIVFDPSKDDHFQTMFSKVNNAIKPVSLAQAITGNWSTEDVLYVTERQAIFKIIEGGSPNGYNVILLDSDPSKCLVLQRNDKNSYTPRQFGFPQDGTSDCAAAAAAYVLSGIGYFDWDSGTYCVSSPVAIQTGQNHRFNGTKLKALGANKVLRAAYVDDWTATGNLTLYGTLSGFSAIAANNEVLFEIEDCKRWLAENITCLDTLGRAFYFKGDSASRAEKGRMSNCYAYRCQTAWDMEANGSTEYNTFSNCGGVGNRVGFKSGAGNIRWIGGVLTDNWRNVELVAGENHLHGKMIGVAINHSLEENILAVDVENGFDFIGCDLYGDSPSAGRVTLRNSQGISISNGLLDCRVQIEAGDGTNTGTNKVINMTIAGENASFQGDLSKLVAFGNTGLGDLDAKAFNRIQPVSIPLINGWAGALELEYSPSSNEVRLRGNVSGGTNQVIGILPVGFRPKTNSVFAIDANGAFGSIAVFASTGGGATAGEIRLLVGSGSSVKLDSCAWQAWQ